MFQPSTSTPPKPLAAAKSMYRFVFSVVAPCFGPELQVMVLMCIPHQMPTYFIGWIQSVLASALGGLRLRPSSEGARSVARSASWMVRQGVTNGVRPRTLMPSAIGASAARRSRLSVRVLPQEHPGVVHQVGLVDHHERAAVLELHGERRLHAVEHAHRAGRVEHLGAVHPGPVGRDPPGPRVVGQGELGELVADLERAQPRLLGQLVAEADAVVEGAHPQGEPPARTPRSPPPPTASSLW